MTPTPAYNVLLVLQNLVGLMVLLFLFPCGGSAPIAPWHIPVLTACNAKRGKWRFPAGIGRAAQPAAAGVVAEGLRCSAPAAEVLALPLLRALPAGFRFTPCPQGDFELG